MPLDSDLKRLLDTLPDRVRDEIARQIAEIEGALAAAIDGERADAAARARTAVEQEAAAALVEAQAASEARGREAGRQNGYEEGREDGLAQGRQEGRDEGRREGYEDGRRDGRDQGRDDGLAQGRAEGRQEGYEEGRLEGREEGREEGRDQGRAETRVLAREAGSRLVEAVRALERGRSLSEILDTLTSCAHSHARRVAVLLVRGDRLRGWRFDGFEPALDQTNAFEMALADGELIARAVETGATTSGAGGTGDACPPFAEHLSLGEMLAVPLHVSGQVVAVLYADDAGSLASDPDGTAAWKIPLEIMTRHASRCLEVVTAIRTAQAMTAPSGASWPKGSKAARQADT